MQKNAGICVWRLVEKETWPCCGKIGRGRKKRNHKMKFAEIRKPPLSVFHRVFETFHRWMPCKNERRAA